MPFSGIKPGSELEQKIDRCMSDVMRKQGVEKSRAIAICRAAIPGASKRTKKAKPPSYRSAGPASTKNCETCKFKGVNGRCSKFSFKVDSNGLCNDWLPNIKALRKRGRQLQTEKAEVRGYSARAGQQIAGSLYRGQGGKFSSGPSGQDVTLLNQFSRGLKLSGQATKRLIDAGLITAEGKITPKGKAMIKPVASKPKKGGGGKKKPKKGGGGKGGGKGKKKKPDQYDAFLTSLNDAERALLADFVVSGKKGEGLTAVFTKLQTAGFVQVTDGKATLTETGIKLFKRIQKQAKTKTATGNPSPVMAHGPGGLYSTLGSKRGIANAMILPNRKRAKKEIAAYAVVMKRSRGPAEQRAMFAKMGASGSLQAKGPDGKRTGAKIGGGIRVDNTRVEDEESYVLRKGGALPSNVAAHGQNFGKNRVGQAIQRQRSEAFSRQLHDVGEKRKRARQEYNDLVSKGKIRKPNSIEHGIIAMSLSDSQRRGAGRRLLSKRLGIPENFTRDQLINGLKQFSAKYPSFKISKTVLNNILSTFKQHTLKRSRGGAEQRAMFAKMGTANTAYPRHGGKRMSPKQIERQEMKKWLDSIPSGGGGVEDKILPPPGKAPKGEGREYQTRRWIHGRIRKFEDRKTALRQATSGDRGTKRDVQRFGRNQIAIDSINQSLEVARHVIKNLLDAGENFTDSKELFQELFSLPAALLGGM